MENQEVKKNKENEIAAQSIVLGFYKEVQELIIYKSQYSTFINQILYNNSDEKNKVTSLEQCVLTDEQISALSQIIFNILQLVEVIKFRYISFKNYKNIKESEKDEIIIIIKELNKSFDIDLKLLDELLFLITIFYNKDVIKGLNFSNNDLLQKIYG